MAVVTRGAAASDGNGNIGSVRLRALFLQYVTGIKWWFQQSDCRIYQNECCHFWPLCLHWGGVKDFKKSIQRRHNSSSSKQPTVVPPFQSRSDQTWISDSIVGEEVFLGPILHFSVCEQCRDETMDREDQNQLLIQRSRSCSLPNKNRSRGSSTRWVRIYPSLVGCSQKSKR